jgi:hypothetical protein
MRGRPRAEPCCSICRAKGTRLFAYRTQMLCDDCLTPIEAARARTIPAGPPPKPRQWTVPVSRPMTEADARASSRLTVFVDTAHRDRASVGRHARSVDSVMDGVDDDGNRRRGPR